MVIDDLRKILVTAFDKGLSRRRRQVVIDLDDYHKLVAFVAQFSKFDEELYLELNPDVAEGIDGGMVESAHQHFLYSGFLEGRCPSVEGFSAEAYFDLNPDLQSAFEKSDEKGLLEHYIKAGYKEGRKCSKEEGELV